MWQPIETDILPEPRVVVLEINGERRFYYTWSDAALEELCLGDLKPFGLLDAQVWLDCIVENFNRKREDQ